MEDDMKKTTIAFLLFLCSLNAYAQSWAYMTDDTKLAYVQGVILGFDFAVEQILGYPRELEFQKVELIAMTQIVNIKKKVDTVVTAVNMPGDAVECIVYEWCRTVSKYGGLVYLKETQTDRWVLPSALNAFLDSK
jgi:hypothetical protein